MFTDEQRRDIARWVKEHEAAESRMDALADERAELDALVTQWLTTEVGR